MKKVIFSISLLILAMMLIACRPTPKEEIVVNKNDGKLETKIADSSTSKENEKIRS